MCVENIDLNSCLKIEIVGLITSEAYQRAKFIVNCLRKYYPKAHCAEQVTGLLEVKWQEYLYSYQKEKGGPAWTLQRPVMVVINGSFLGSDEEFLSLMKTKYSFVEPSLSSFQVLAYEEYTKFLNLNPRRTFVYFEISIGSRNIGGLMFELYSDLLPETCDRFTNLCNKNNKSGMSYYGAAIHRVCKSGWFQGGEIYGAVQERFPDENYSISHDQRGVLSMANDGKHSNTTQFFITFQPSQWMDRYYVAFGQVVEGTNVMREIENCPCTYESPNQPITITNCGVLPVGKELRKQKQELFLKKQKQITRTEEPYPITTKDFILKLLKEEIEKNLPDDPTDFFIAMLFKAIWDKLPPLDELDSRDVSSKHYLDERYKAGLYSLQYQLTKDMLMKYKMSTPKGSFRQEMVDFVVHFVQKRKLYDTESQVVEIESNDFVDKYELEDIYKTAVLLVDEIRKEAVKQITQTAYETAVKIVTEIIEAAKRHISQAKLYQTTENISHGVFSEGQSSKEIDLRLSIEETTRGDLSDIITEGTTEGDFSKIMTEEATKAIASNVIEEESDIIVEVESQWIETDEGTEEVEETTENIAHDIINGLIEIALKDIVVQ